MDDVTAWREPHLVVAPIAMTAFAVGDAELIPEHAGIQQLNMSVVVRSKETNALDTLRTSLRAPEADSVRESDSSHPSCGQR